MATIKNPVFIRLQLENCYLVGELTFDGKRQKFIGDDWENPGEGEGGGVGYKIYRCIKKRAC